MLNVLPLFSCATITTTYTIVVRPSRSEGGAIFITVLRSDFNGVNVSTLVGLNPEFLDDLIYLVHLEAVVPHNGTVQCLVVLFKILISSLCCLQQCEDKIERILSFFPENLDCFSLFKASPTLFLNEFLLHWYIPAHTIMYQIWTSTVTKTKCCTFTPHHC